MKAFIVLLLAAVASAQFPNWQPAPPQRPNNPSARVWRDPVSDSRCPTAGNDDHLGNALILNDPTNAAGFRICWGGWAWPFNCPRDTVWWGADPTGPSCAFPSQIPAWNPQFPNFRPFDNEEKSAEE